MVDCLTSWWKQPSQQAPELSESLNKSEMWAETQEFVSQTHNKTSSSMLFVCFSEKKKEKEREELWKKLEDLELKRGLRSDGIIPT